METNVNPSFSTNRVTIYCVCNDNTTKLASNIGCSPRVYENINQTRSGEDNTQDLSVKVKVNIIKGLWSQTFLWVKLILLLALISTSISYCYYRVHLYFDPLPYPILAKDKLAYINEETSNVCLIQHEYYVNSWFIMSHIKLEYYCKNPKLVTIINIQGLQITGHACNDTSHCLELIAVYLDIVDTYSKYSFYIDYDGNVYSGRTWYCPYFPGEIWVAIMVEDFGPNTTASERERIIKHLKEDIFPYATQCNYYSSSLQINYLNTTIFQGIDMVKI